MGIALFLFVFCLCFSGNSLRQGQQIKQFASYSVTQSLAANGFKIFETYWPCVDTRNGKYPRPWAEEPPLFYLYSAMLEYFGLGPQWAPLFVFLVLNLLLLVLLKEAFAKQFLPLFVIAATIPVQMRYSYQHLPDMLATLFLLGAVYFFSKNKGLFFLCCLLAVTAKALAGIPAAFFILYWLKPKDAKKLILAGVLIALLAVPFLLWVGILWEKGIPNPFDFRHPFTNRHSGGFEVLLTAKYWNRLFTFIGTKGVGWILFLFFLSRAKKDWVERELYANTKSLLLLWAWSFVPFWLLVREASVIHDHYVLQYALPMGILGAEALLKIRQVPLRNILLVATVVWGLSNPVSWRLATDQTAAPSKFCEQEEHSLMKFPENRIHINL